MKPSCLLVLCNCPDETTAAEIANRLVAERLAACVNRIPGVDSLFRWQGSVDRATEELLLIKTTSQVYPALETRLAALHPYELPEIIAVPLAEGSAAYLKWIEDSTDPA